MVELTLDEKKAIILDIMKDIDRFCRANDIRYTISSGTLLGAVRHGGFIPWDDDGDMFMLREDFDRFVKIYKSDRYHLLYNTKNDDEFLMSGFAKVNDPTTAKKSSVSLTRFGVNVDVFPLDAVPEDPKKRHKFMHKVMSAHNRLHHRQKTDLLSKLKSYAHSMEWWWNKVDRLIHDNPFPESKYVAHIVGSPNYRTVIKKARFDDLGEIEFEGYRFMAFSDPHSYLAIAYGDDYMTPPPENKRWIHNLSIYRKS